MKKEDEKKQRKEIPRKRKSSRMSPLKIRATQPGGPVIKSYASPNRGGQPSDFADLSPFNPKERADPELDEQLQRVSDARFSNPALRGAISTGYSIGSTSPTEFGMLRSLRSRSFDDLSDAGGSYDENFSVAGRADDISIPPQIEMSGPLNIPYPSIYRARQLAAISTPDYSLQIKKNESFMKELWLSKMKELEIGLAPIRVQAEKATKHHRDGILALEQEYVQQNHDIQRRMEEVERKASIALHEAHLANNIVRLDEQASLLLNQTDAMLKMGTWHGQ